MPSESARVSSAAEARYRVQTPPSTGRVVRVIALDSASDGDVVALVQQVPAADLVVMVTTAGADAYAAAIIGDACSRARVMTTTLVVHPAAADDEALAKTLAQVRPWSLMVVIVGEDDYLDDILGSFR